ncbi:serine/threonine-protein kinase [Dictyobacter kobayashii]|uniref:Protein kinase domain-containing protein n=1 Tax=Dictyobacter kobayashii TaxID=2014872 RepID=A0A402AV15_9CHLR|nr:serine/threonine-protein kinase [Dictyobacter kobayashii]GCE22853.1 hypothetical protein KDK_66530 [Dictyobacter kobayashii]
MLNYTGKQLGNYYIQDLLGEGGFAQVYRGEHIYLQKTAAIKVLLTYLSEKDLERFLREAQLIAHLHHPQMVRVQEFGIDEETQTPFLVMTYAPNGTLRTRHPKGSRVPLEAVVAYVRQMASALQYAHEQKLIHRDVKPENMLIGRNNEILLSDFGIATVDRSTISRSGNEVAGTVSYMAPEQIHGHPRPASDQYALGIVAYEWLCGEHPFKADHLMQMVAQHLTAEPPPLSQKLPIISPHIEQVIMQTLAKEAAQRYPSISEFATALEDAYLRTTTISRQYTGSELAARHLTTATNDTPITYNTYLDPANALSTAAGAGASQSTMELAMAQAITTPSQLPDLKPTRSKQPTSHLSRRTVTAGLAGLLGLTTLGGGGLIWYLHSPSNAPKPAKPAAPVVIPTRSQGSTLLTYTGHTDIVTGLSWSPDNHFIASSSHDKTVQVWSVLNEPALRSYIYNAHKEPVNAVAWAPNGKSIASLSQSETARVWQTPEEAGNGNGRTIYTMSRPTTPNTLNTSATSTMLAWSPDSQRLAANNNSNNLEARAWDATTGERIIEYPDPTQSAAPATNAIAWSPNGQYLVSSVLHTLVWDVEHVTAITSYQGHNFDSVKFDIPALAWSPDSKRIASGCTDKTVQVWDALSGQTYLTYKGHSATVNAVAWSPDGKYLASASDDKTVQIWEAATGQHLFTYLQHRAPVMALAWSPDNQHIVSGGADKHVMLWQATQ